MSLLYNFKKTKRLFKIQANVKKFNMLNHHFDDFFNDNMVLNSNIQNSWYPSVDILKKIIFFNIYKQKKYLDIKENELTIKMGNSTENTVFYKKRNFFRKVYDIFYSA